MGIISRTGDLFYAFRFLKLLVTPWEETKAFEQGIVDENGKTVKKSRDLQTTETNLSEAQIRKVLEKVLGEPIDFDDIISETSWFQQDDHLLPGVYSLVEDIASPLTGEIIAFTKSKIKVTETLAPYDNFFGANIYEVYHPQTNQKIFISNRDIKR